MEAQLDIWVYYPLPFRDEIDEVLQKFDGWYGSGVAIQEQVRDNSIRGTIADLEAILILCPDDGYLRLWKK